jgi:hypothetical protein
MALKSSLIQSMTQLCVILITTQRLLEAFLKGRYCLPMLLQRASEPYMDTEKWRLKTNLEFDSRHCFEYIQPDERLDIHRQL